MFVLYLIVILAIIYGIISFSRVALGKSENEEWDHLPGGKAFLVTGIVSLLALIILNTCLVKIGPTEIGVKTTPSGVSSNELYPRWYILAPWVTVKKMDNTIWVYSTVNEKEENNTIWAATRGDSSNTIGSKIGLDFSVNWKINPTEGSWIYQNLGADQEGDGRYSWIEEHIVRPSIISAVNNAVREYTIFQANNKRDEIQTNVKTQVTEELAKNHLLTLDVQIRGVHFDPSLEDKIKLTQANRQEAENQKEVTKQLAEKEIQAVKSKNIQITGAQGEAEAMRVRAQALESNPKLVDYEYVQALKISAEQGVKIVPDMSMGSSVPNMLFNIK